MANIITYTNFVDPYYIDTTAPQVQSDVNVWCGIVEKKMLKKLLGITLWTAFNSGRTADPYKTLIDGSATAFEYDGITRVYEGLSEMLTAFTYFYYLQTQGTFNSPMGQMQANTTNAERVFPVLKLVTAWNEGRRLYYEAIDYIYYKNSIIADTFADFLPEDIDEINTFGI